MNSPNMEAFRMSLRLPTRRSRVVLTALSAAVLLVTTACGNRNSHAAVVAAAQGQGAAGLGGNGTSSTAPGLGGTASRPTTGNALPGGSSSTTGTKGGTASGSNGSTNGANGPQNTTPVMICQLGHFSGLGGPTQGNAQPGLASWVEWTNAHGGLAGHPIRLDSKDDEMDPNRAQQIVQNCVQNEHAVAIVGAFIPATVDSIASYVQQHKIPVIGGDGVTTTWFTNPDFFPEGSSQTGTGNGQVRIMISAHKSSAGIIYCTENVACSQGKDYFTQAAKSQGLAIKGTYQVSLANPSFTSQCSSMRSAKIDAVYIALDGSSAMRLARDCNAIGYHPLLDSGGLAIDASAAASDPNLNGMTITTSVFPWMTSTSPAAQDFQKAMSTYAPDIVPTESAAKAWVSGQLLAKAISNAGAAARSGPITSAMILNGLHAVKHETLGGLVMGQLNYVTGKPAVPNVCWSVAKLVNGKWTAPQGAKASCA
jgi:branched-chain amino acid transport system substrate-binding protein